jgi:hypothetical protein
MAKKKNLTIDTLWKLERAGAPSLAPDGAQAVCCLLYTSDAADDM